VRTPDPIAIAKRLPEGWGVIYRHFGKPTRGETAAALSKIAKSNHLALLIAADPDLALTVKADGVHWPELQLGKARRWAKTFPLMTASAHSPAAIRRAENSPIDAALVSTVFASNSNSAGKPMGAIALKRIAAQTALPIYGLGGISASNAHKISSYAGLACIEGISDAFGV